MESFVSEIRSASIDSIQMGDCGWSLAANSAATRLADDWRAYTDIHLLPIYAENGKIPK
jgi:hypothetical protein